MKKIIHLSVMALALAAFATTNFANYCGGECPADDSGSSNKGKTEEGARS